MEEKTCFKCGHTKPINEFYGHPRMADGHLNKCKKCARADVSANYRVRHDQYVEYERQRAVLPHRRAAVKQYALTHRDVIQRGHRQYRQRYPERAAAHNAVSNAIRDGRLARMPCEICGDLKVHAHHTDYSKPLDVMWLCRRHHLEQHGKEAYN